MQRPVVLAVVRGLVKRVAAPRARAAVACAAWVGAAWVGAAVVAAGCARETPVQLYVDGFAPDNVRFEVDDLGPQGPSELAALKKRADIDGALLLPAGACPGPCRAAIVSVFVTNRGTDAEPPPVVRLDVPAGRPRRLPIAFRDQAIERGRIGRIRWLVEMYPDEAALTAVLSSSVRLEVAPTAPTAPTTTAPTTTAPTTTAPTTTAPPTTAPPTTAPPTTAPPTTATPNAP